MASSIARGPVPKAPCSGRSETISTSGSGTVDDSSPHVSGSVPAAAAPAVLTHADPAPAASAWAAPIRVRDVTLAFAGSTRVTMPST